MILDFKRLGVSSLEELIIPDELEDLFSCRNNKITSLKGSPKIRVRGDFDCCNNYLNSLNHSPKEVPKF